jgi:phospholipase C
MHPECNLVKFFGPSNLHRGEALIWTIYDAVRNSPDWESTLLLILFDEHGGCYDHVPPPSVSDCKVSIAPDSRIIPGDRPGGTGFAFDRLGPRVPALVISAYTPTQTRLHDVFEHTSVLRTVVNCFTLPEDKLGARQIQARDVSAAISLSEPRSDRPAIAKPEFSFLTDLGAEMHSLAHAKLLGAKEKPLSDLQKTALHGAALLTQADELHERIEHLQNELEASLLLIEREARFVTSKYL